MADIHDLASALPFGYSLIYWAKIEGVPYLLGEYEGNANAPSGYSIDDSLIIDNSAQIGSIVDFDSGLGKGFDLELKFYDTAVVRSLFSRPSLTTVLSDDLAAADTTAYAYDVSAWGNTGTLYIGTSAIPYAAKDNGLNLFESLTRGSYGTAKSYSAGTLIYDGPRYWIGRKVDLYATLLGPTGKFIQDASIIGDEAAHLWTGQIASRPEKDENGIWSFQARTLERKLTDSLSSPPSGKAKWSPVYDFNVAYDTGSTLAIRVTESDFYLTSPSASTNVDVVLQPFSASSGLVSTSQIRQNISDAFDSATTSNNQVNGLIWQKQISEQTLALTSGKFEKWKAFIEFQRETTGSLIGCVVAETNGRGLEGLVRESPLYPSLNNYPENGDSEFELLDIGVEQWLNLIDAQLDVIIEEGSPSDVPSAGYVKLTYGSDQQSVYRYTSYTTNTLDGSVSLDIATADRSRLRAEAANYLFNSYHEESDEIQVEFLFRDTGKPKDLMLRQLMSDGGGGSYDTLGEGQGYGISEVNTGSFEKVFANEFEGITAAISTEAGTSFSDIFSGLLRLSRRGIVSYHDSTGTKLKAIHIGSPESAVIVDTIDDSVLAPLPGQRPIQKEPVNGNSPRVIRIKPVLDGEEQAELKFQNVERVEFGNEAWDLNIEGINRGQLLQLGFAWSRGIFTSIELSRVYRASVPMSVKGQAGDIVYVDTESMTCYDPSTGEHGYTGLARVIGAQFHLDSAHKTIYFETDAGSLRMPLSPSAPIVAVNGTATEPTSIDISTDYSNIFDAFDTDGSFEVLAYKPTEDSFLGSYTISSVQETGGVCRLTVSSYPYSPSISLDTTYRITLPVSGSSNEYQNRYLHNTSNAVWG